MLQEVEGNLNWPLDNQLSEFESERQPLKSLSHSYGLQIERTCVGELAWQTFTQFYSVAPFEQQKFGSRSERGK